jgi:hypothetical protein
MIWSPPSTRGGKLTKRKPTRGYAIDSGDDASCGSEYESDREIKIPLFDDGWDDDTKDLEDKDGCIIRIDGVETVVSAHSISILPQFSEEISTQPELSLAKRILASFTVYRELKAATSQSDYGSVFARLQMEWTYVGGVVRF